MDVKQRKKHDEQVSLEYKRRKEKRKQEKEKAKATNQKELLEPNIKGNIVVWDDKNNDGNIYEGSFGNEKCFEIKRSILTFTLKIIHKELKFGSKNNSSTELIKLQERANKILWSNPEFLRKFKSIS